MIDLEKLRADYAALEAEFGKEGALIITGIRAEHLENALNSENDHAVKLYNFLQNRITAYNSYSSEQCLILRNLENFIIESGSAGKAAKKMGISSSVVSDIRNYKYRGVVSKMFADIASYLSLNQEKKETKIYKGTDYVPTSVSEYIYQVIRGVHLAGDCEIITGDTGVGKTRTISKYASDYPENTIVVTPSYANTSVIGIMKLIAAQLGISDLNRLNDLNDAVLNRLHDGMLIIVDEAQHLKFPAIDHLRCLSDIFTDKGETMGICFVGNPSFMRHFDEKKLPVTGQVFNRANLRPYIKSLDIKLEDIQLLFPKLVDDNRIAETKFLYAVAQTNGEGVRRAMNFYKTAYNMDGGDVTLERLAELAQTGTFRIPNIGSLIKRLREEAVA
ncbi:MAG: AAA family ATPase [Ruminococcus sp.]|nr:AAA family ATPase [Ruminococcus sp.]